MANEGCGGFALTYTFWMNDRPIAGALGLEHRGSLLVILNGFDEEGYRRQSIGSLMFEQLARDCIERGDHHLDFTIGDEPYKGIFGGQGAGAASAGNRARQGGQTRRRHAGRFRQNS